VRARSILVVAALAPGCDRGAASGSGAAPEGQPTATSVAKAPATALPTSPGCRLLDAASSFTLGPMPGQLPTEDEEEPLALPNAVEIGEAVRLGSRFAVGFLLEAGGETHAHVAWVSAEADGGHVLDLGRVYGVVPPPRLAASGHGLLVGIADGDVNGTATRLVRLDGEGRDAVVREGARVPQGNDESPVFGLAAADRSAVLVWDQWDAAGRGEILASVFDPATGLPRGEPRRLSPEGTDAETPHVVSDAAGFWVAWMEHGVVDRGQKQKKPKQQKPRNEEIEADIAPGVTLGPRSVQLIRLDANGAPRGAPLRVTPEQGSVLGHDVVPLARGALVVWREDATSPATPGGRLLSVRVHEDGSTEQGVVTEEDVGPGDPVLLSSRPEDARWLVFASADDAVRLAAVDEEGRIGEARREEALRRGIPLAAARDRLLVATPRGRSVELTVLACRR
jgi:hypothetical protein